MHFDVTLSATLLQVKCKLVTDRLCPYHEKELLGSSFRFVLPEYILERFDAHSAIRAQQLSFFSFSYNLKLSMVCASVTNAHCLELVQSLLYFM